MKAFDSACNCHYSHLSHHRSLGAERHNPAALAQAEVTAGSRGRLLASILAGGSGTIRVSRRLREGGINGRNSSFQACRLQNPEIKRAGHSRKVSTRWASATTGAGGATGPSDMAGDVCAGVCEFEMSRTSSQVRAGIFYAGCAGLRGDVAGVVGGGVAVRIYGGGDS
jgi:hypothetical protein